MADTRFSAFDRRLPLSPSSAFTAAIVVDDVVEPAEAVVDAPLVGVVGRLA